MHAVPEVSAEEAGSVFVFPATLAQRRFWLLDQLQPGGNSALHIPLALRLRGPLDPPLLQRALNQVVARHEALRTRFESDRGQLRQIIAPSLRLDLQSQPAFDLSRGPLLRVRLVRLAPLEHLLELSVHHIVSDGWSNGILLRDLFACYTALLEGKAAALPELTIQFADYAEWQQTRLQKDDFAEQRIYWQRKLAGDLPGLDLPYHCSNRTGSFGETRSAILPPALARSAKSFAARENASPFMIFFAIFQTLLHRYTAATDFLVTTPSANRDRAEFDAVVGPFANPLIMRANLRDDPTFAGLLGRVREVALEAFANQDIPFETLLDEFRAARLQVNFHYDAGLQQALPLPSGLTSEALPSASTGTVYELSASVLEEPDGLRLELEYDPALFEAGTIERMLGHYQTLLESGLADPLQAVSKLAILTPPEKESSALETTPANAPLDIRSALVERVLAKPDAMIARHGRRELSCAELLVRLESISHQTAASDLNQAAAWIEHWRARVDSLPPMVSARSPEVEGSLAAASIALRESARFKEFERVASCSIGLGAAEEIGAALLANAMLVYPTAELLTDSPGAFATWLEAENIAVACLPAAIWNRLTITFARKTRRPSKLRMVILTEGGPEEGSFGRFSEEDAIQACRREVMEEGTRLRVQDMRSGQLQPIGIVGELVGDQAAGELARRLPNESIERLGPIGAQRYTNGFRVDFRATEEALQGVPGIRHALVRPIASDLDAPFVAYVVPDPGAMPDFAALRQHLREQRRPNLALPSAFISLKDIPLRADNGRLDLAALPLPELDQLDGTPEPVRPYLGLQLQLIAIWEEVLGVRGIGIRDNFFDLGGNSLLAMRMLQRAEAACGKVILPTTLFRHPTIEQLAAEIAREARDESPALLRVHDAGSRTPLFYLHGDLSGGGFYSLKLSRALGSEQPFYVLPPQDIRMLSAAPSIEEMAAAHLQALRAVRPKGPYVIGGFCIGGLVAYELAQQVRASGETVETLLIIDATPDRTLRALRWMADSLGALFRWDGETKVAHFGRWAVWRARLALRFAPQREKGTRKRPRTLAQRLDATRGFIRRRFAQHAAELETSSTALPERDLPSAFRWASAGYDPQPYSGAMALLLSEDVLSRADNISRRWQQLAPRVTVEPLRGSHLECITEHVEALAEKIEVCLERVPNE